MANGFAVLWALNGTPCVGLAEVGAEGVVLTSRGRSLSLPFDTIRELDVWRSATERLRGLPVLALKLVGGDVVRVASLGGAGSLHELTESIGESRASARDAHGGLGGDGRPARGARLHG